MHNTTCLNCGTPIAGKFCHECGQKSDTHRITPKHFFMHDIVHGVFHIDKGIVFTLKETFTRPGYAALDYVHGKRKNYYNIFYLIFLILGFYMIANGHEASVQQADKMFIDLPGQLPAITKFVFIYLKYLILLTIPVLALSSFISFQRLNFNFAEHIILSGFVTLGCFIFLLVGTLLDRIHIALNLVVSLLAPALFCIFVYYQATKKKYKLGEFGLRLILFALLSFIWASFIVGMLIVAFFVN